MRNSTPSPDHPIIAIIPAAGKGERFGVPKARAMIGNLTFLEHIEKLLRELSIPSISLIDLETPDMLATLKIGLQRARESYPDAISHMIFPVDHPFVNPDTINLLTATATSNPTAIIKPAYHSQSGHPIILPTALDPEAYPDAANLRQIISQSGYPILWVETNDPAVLRNINHQADMIHP